jgi:DnaK suppressor protein
MDRTPTEADNEQREVLRLMLLRLREETYQRVRSFRHERDLESEPGDAIDAARSNADVETCTGLAEHAEEKLSCLNEALLRLEKGRYGICLRCHQPISIVRLRAVPFAALCFACES